MFLLQTGSILHVSITAYRCVNTCLCLHTKITSSSMICSVYMAPISSSDIDNCSGLQANILVRSDMLFKN